ncbi:hypothetical protein M6B38_261720 [Iris pallida]|uniref:Uncharacterized protein n=1 Tax=Iris pallida TaxID=29817 RepID=A0AAX6GWZ9_IRIPA|nr:hypothetical protein M6B38_341735 [Iris pallida]KAJ6851322.1 hypothetical protein M6B38_261720 [Iris pallida]
MPPKRPRLPSQHNHQRQYQCHYQHNQHPKPVTVSGPVCPCSNFIPLLQTNYRVRVDRPTRTSRQPNQSTTTLTSPPRSP